MKTKSVPTKIVCPTRDPYYRHPWLDPDVQEQIRRAREEEMRRLEEELQREQEELRRLEEEEERRLAEEHRQRQEAAARRMRRDNTNLIIRNICSHTRSFPRIRICWVTTTKSFKIFKY
jgi:hypothetical protein